nr:unnamed protein product [Callosobruchus analis]
MDVRTSESDSTRQKSATDTYNEVNIDDAIEEHNRGISRAAYIQLHRTHSNKLTNNLKKKYEKQTDENQEVSPKKQETKTKIPIPKPRSLHLLKQPKHSNSKSKISFPSSRKDENANDVIRKCSSSSEEYISIILRSESEESLDKVNKELSLFTMDKNPKEKKKSSSFRRILTGKIFTKDKKKKEEEKPTYDFDERSERTEANAIDHEANGGQIRPDAHQGVQSDQEQLREPQNPEKPARSGTITYRRFEPKYADVSSSASTLTSEGTFGENVSAKPEVKLERNSTTSSDTKLKRSPSIEVSKLKLPPNRDVVTLSRVKSPISHDYNNTDKEIATELLKPKRSPTPNQNVKSLSPTHKNSSSSVEYRNNIFEDRRSESFPHRMQTFSPIVCNRDGIYEKVVNEALTPAREEDKRESTESPSPIQMEDRRSKFLSSPIQNCPSSSDKENSYEKRMIRHLSPSRQMFTSLNTTKQYRNEDTRNNSSFLMINQPRTRIPAIAPMKASGLLTGCFHHTTGLPFHLQIKTRLKEEILMDPWTIQTMWSRITRIETWSLNILLGFRICKTKASRGMSLRNIRLIFRTKKEQTWIKMRGVQVRLKELWKYRQSSTHSPGSHHSSPTSDHMKQTLDRREMAEDDVQTRNITFTEPRNAFQVQSNLPRQPETECISSGSHNIPRNADHMIEKRLNPNMYRNNQRPRHLPIEQPLRPHINPNECLPSYDNNQTTQNPDMYPPQNTNYNHQLEEQTPRHQIRQHRNVPSQDMRHNNHQLTRNIPFPPQDLRRRPPQSQRQVFFPPESPNYGVYKNVPPPANLVRSSTPNNLTQSPLKPVSPQKEELRKSVEAYYWKEIKKLKEQENLELYYYQMNMVPYLGYAEDPGSLRRSRSMLPTNDRNSRRSLSLPRNVPNDKPVTLRQHPVLQQKPVIYQNDPLYVQQFKRNAPERRTIDGSNRTSSIYRPIFKRGSLTTPVKQQDDPQYKKVSFRHFEENLPRRQTGQNSLGPRSKYL